MYHLIPQPQKITVGEGRKAIEPTISSFPEYADAAASFAAYAQTVTGVAFTRAPGGSIVLGRDKTIAPEGYRLTVCDTVRLAASTPLGMQHALSALLQLLEVEDGQVFVPQATVIDEPECDYRGIMIDLARDWHEFPVLLRYVDLCWFYRISVLHLHFTDDQSYTLPSDLFPKLPTEGRHYTKKQIAELVAYAQARGVQLQPEIDVPGHSTPFRDSNPEVFGADGIIALNETSVNAMRGLFGEMCALFPHSTRIHIGGDEAAIAKWTENESSLAYAQANGIDTATEDKRLLAEQMLALFINKMAEVVVAAGKQPVAWEGFAKAVNGSVRKDILMMSWENFYQVAPDLLAGGFEILNCSWNPMYVVAPAVFWKPEEVFDWNITAWKPVHPQSPYITTGGVTLPDCPAIRGGQLQAWGDQIEKNFPVVAEGVKLEFDLVAERAPMLAENTWHREKVRSYEDFAQAAEALSGKFAKIRNA